MAEWHDPFTGIRYEWTSDWEEAVRGWVATSIAPKLSSDAKASANAVAQFWKESYYRSVFPLRYGRAEGEKGYARGKPLNTTHLANSEIRKGFLDGTKLPPILTAKTDPNLLIADHHLAVSALLNVALRRIGVEEQTVHQVRLGALIHEFCDRVNLDAYPLAKATAHYLNGTGACPAELSAYGDLLVGIHESHTERIGSDLTIAIVGVSAQRIKQYVYESPGLQEIRGASALLDKIVEQLADEVADQIGAEVVLQSAASTLLFLAPEPSDWSLRFKRAFYEQTRVAFVASASHEVPLAQFINRYADSMRAFLSALDADRYRAEMAFYDALPFEQRCGFCRTRPAEGFTEVTGETEPIPICYPCLLKRTAGQAERRTLARNLAKEIGLPNEVAVPPSLNELVPQDPEHKQIAFIYGDGRNFGQITKNLKSLAQSLQWTNRAQIVVESATLLALGASLDEAQSHEAVALQHYPFEVLVMGGDDFSLFCWSRLALRFCQQFLYLTDWEFQKGDANQCIVGETPIGFGIGCLISDEKAPVRLTVEFTGEQLLKWAKKPINHFRRGAVALLSVASAEQIPGDFEAFKERAYIKRSQGKLGATTIYLTRRPYTADDLDALLKVAWQVRDELGTLQRLVEPFVNQPPLSAVLHYLYQKARAEKSGRSEKVYEQLSLLNAPVHKERRPRLGSDTPSEAFFVPLWDVLEIVKSLR